MQVPISHARCRRRCITIRSVLGIPESEAGQIWTAMREARVRALYFGEMAARYTRRRQVVQGLSLGFVSGAFIALVREPWPVVAAAFMGIVAAVNIWSTATNLDQTLTTLVTLRIS